MYSSNSEEIYSISEDYDGYGTVYNSGNNTVQMNNITAVAILGSAFVAAILIFFLIARMKDPKSELVRKIRDFLCFRNLIIDGIIEFLYIFAAIVLSATSVYTMFQFKTVDYSILVGLAMLIVGNIVLRVGYELVMLLAGLWQNTSDIYKLLEDKFGAVAPKAAEKKKETKVVEEKAETSKK